MKNNKLICIILAAGVSAAITGCNRASHTLTIVTYNVGVFHKADTNTIRMVAEMMNEVGADVLSLNELDSCTVRTGNECQLDSLSRELGGWNSRYASTIDFQGGRYGIGIASRPELEILDFHKVFLPKEESREQRVLAVAEFKDFVLATTHLDHSSESDRLKQAMKVTEWMKAHYGDSKKPVFLCGDMNAAPESATLSEYRKSWTVLSSTAPTFPSHDPHNCIDYIMALDGAGRCVVTETAVMQNFETGNTAIASDHLPVKVCVQW